MPGSLRYTPLTRATLRLPTLSPCADAEASGGAMSPAARVGASAPNAHELESEGIYVDSTDEA